MMTEIYLEVGSKKTFACSLQWPGWCRSGKTEEAAIQTLIDYTPRYRVITQRAGLAFQPDTPVVVERVPGDTTTDFGAPSVMVASDAEVIDTETAEQGVALLQAAWEIMDEVVAVSPNELRKGPRGGGRDRDEIVRHVIEVERNYARKIGVRHKPFPMGDRTALEELRRDICDVLGKEWDGTPLVSNGWPPMYALRRTTWHVIDHLWEIEDRR